MRERAANRRKIRLVVSRRGGTEWEAPHTQRGRGRGAPIGTQRQDQARARGGGLGGADRSALNGADPSGITPVQRDAGKKKTMAPGAPKRRILPGHFPSGDLALSPSCSCFACCTARQIGHISPSNVFCTATANGIEAE